MKTSRARILVFGGQGQLGRALLRRASVQAVQCLVVPRSRVDIRSGLAVRAAVCASGANLIVNAAAYTQVDRAENDAEAAFAVNRDGAANVAEAASRSGVPCIHLSTDYVFDGALERAYVEGDATGPLGVYGASKLAGEAEVRRLAPEAMILRTAWVFDQSGSGFVRTLFDLAQHRDHLQVVGDQFGSPTHVDDLADAILGLAISVARGARPAAGTYHLAGPTGLSRFAWIEILLDVLARHGGRRVTAEAVPSSTFPTAARRPRNSMLDSTRIERELGIRLPDLMPTMERTVIACLDETRTRRSGS